MDKTTTIAAELREEFGKNAARRMRRAGRIPAVMYGAGGSALPLAVDPKQISQILYSESGHNTLFTVEIKGRTPARVMLKDWQVEPVKGNLLHVDMVRIAADARLKVKVPIHLTGEPQGVKVQGGILDFVLREVEIECLPDDIPEHITVDVSGLTIGRHLRAGDLPLGAKVKLLSDPHRVVAHVVAPRAEEEAAAAELAEAAPAEPEVIRKGKAEAEEAEEGAEKAEKAEKGEKSERKEGK
jgi:large subunit ribosomal protein L25